MCKAMRREATSWGFSATLSEPHSAATPVSRTGCSSRHAESASGIAREPATTAEPGAQTSTRPQEVAPQR